MITQLAAVLLAGLAPQAEQPDLHGQVLTEAGVPVPEATVFVYTAAPREGTSPL
jgi:hypothetical protein